jgi:phosphoglucosamine mutase
MKYFGTDGIRGKAYEFIDERLSFLVGKSLYQFKNQVDKIVIARDTRESGKMIVENIKKGAILGGLNIVDLGVVATPILAFAAKELDCFGVMVTASHNPYQDNGIKIFNRGKKSSPEEEVLIENVVDNDIDLTNIVIGKELENNEILLKYFQLYEYFPQNLKLKVAFDLANGAGITSAKEVLPKFVSKALFIADKPDGLNINKDSGSTHLDHLTAFVRKNKCDLGIAFDGDADRVLVIDENLEVIDGDLLIYIFAKYLKQESLLKNNIVVLSKMSNLGIIKALNNLGIKVIQTEVGDKYIFQALDQNQAVLGGENSGHIINRTIFDTGDGVLNAWYLLKVIQYFGKKIGDLKKEVSFYPDKLVNIKNIDKEIALNEDVVSLVNKYRDKLGEDGKVLVRPSGTEPLIRVSVSCESQTLVDQIIEDLVKTIEMKREDSK